MEMKKLLESLDKESTEKLISLLKQKSTQRWLESIYDQHIASLATEEFSGEAEEYDMDLEDDPHEVYMEFGYSLDPNAKDLTIEDFLNAFKDKFGYKEENREKYEEIISSHFDFNFDVKI